MKNAGIAQACKLNESEVFLGLRVNPIDSWLESVETEKADRVPVRKVLGCSEHPMSDKRDGAVSHGRG
jgi:hypothetical protein